MRVAPHAVFDEMDRLRRDVDAAVGDSTGYIFVLSPMANAAIVKTVGYEIATYCSREVVSDPDFPGFVGYLPKLKKKGESK